MYVINEVMTMTLSPTEKRHAVVNDDNITFLLVF